MGLLMNRTILLMNRIILLMKRMSLLMNRMILLMKRMSLLMNRMILLMKRMSLLMKSSAINRLKQFRHIATRYEKLAANYTAMIAIASILLWL
ncbi:hypothetical protein FBB35_04285 [Nostoc sp. TCL240-02]|nr:hypothetical protein FBB35_04285 [Nostoc sp. TCL240-02]